MTHRVFIYGLLVFLALGATGLITIVLRNPDTHGHLWSTVPDQYARTPIDEFAPADLEAIKSQLVRFEFPPPPPQYVAAEGGQKPVAGYVPSPAAGESPTGEQPGEVQEVVLTQSEFSFDQTEVRLKAGVPVQLVVSNEGKQVHGIWVPDLAISEEIRSGRSRTFEFTPKAPGKMRFTCSYNLCGTDEEHARMAGYIVVEP